jgi:hypothetical protein
MLSTDVARQQEGTAMGILTGQPHEFWATVSGDTLDDLVRQQELVWQWGVSAVEIRADLVPDDVFGQLLARGGWPGPTFVAHFGTGGAASVARDVVRRALDVGMTGGICHSRCELVDTIHEDCRNAGGEFAAAYHSQEPMTQHEAERELQAQAVREPLFRKIAVRAHRVADALALIAATGAAADTGGIPVVGAVFGPHRWARVAMPHVGSAITFLVARPVPNEVGGNDEQLTTAEADALRGVRVLSGGHLPAARMPVEPAVGALS